MAVELPIICGIFHLNVARDLTGQVQPINRTEDALEKWVLHGYIATELEELVTSGPGDCCMRHLPQNFKEDG